MSEKLKELKEAVEGEMALMEKFLKSQQESIGSAHTEGMIDAYRNVLRWIDKK